MTTKKKPVFFVINSYLKLRKREANTYAMQKALLETSVKLCGRVRIVDSLRGSFKEIWLNSELNLH